MMLEDNAEMHNSETQSPLFSSISQNLPSFNYPTTELAYGITQVKILDEATLIGHCTSVEPLSHDYFDSELDRVLSFHWWHAGIIACTVFFNVFQNTISLYLLATILGVPSYVTPGVVALCALATTMQALLARAFKIIEIPFHLTQAQRTFLSTIKQTLENSRKNQYGYRLELLSKLGTAGCQAGKIYVSIENNTIKYCVKKPDSTYIEHEIPAEKLTHQFPINDDQLLALAEEICSIALRKGHIQNDLLILISQDEDQEMRPLQSSSNERKKEFKYALQIITRHYQTNLHILAVNRDNFSKIDFEKLPLQEFYQVLAYSPDYYSSKDYLSTARFDIEKASVKRLRTPHVFPSSPSIKRYVSSKEYSKFVHNSRHESESLIANIVYSSPSFLLLVLGPIFATTLQGTSSLNDTLKQMGLGGNSLWLRLVLIVLGSTIGASKAYMTYKTKVPPAIQRSSKLSKKSLALLRHLNCATITESELTTNVVFKPNKPSFSDLYQMINRDLSFSWHSTYKIYLLISFYTAPLIYQLFGIVSALGTINFYAGLGLFFSTSGLTFILETMGKTVNPSDKGFVAFCIYLSLCNALLNGFYNQGWEACKKFFEYGEDAQAHIYDLIQLPQNNLSWHMPEIIQDIGTKNSRGQNIILFFTLIDSFAASVTAYNGSTQTQEAFAHLWPSVFASSKNIIPIMVAFCIYISQTCFSFELYKRDEKVGGNLWGKVIDIYCPEWFRNISCIKHAISYPKTDHYHCNHTLFARLKPPLTISKPETTSTSSAGSLTLSDLSPTSGRM